MTSEILAAAFVTGILVKIVDQFEDKKVKLFKNANTLLGITYGFLIAYVMLKSDLVANLWMAAVLGNLIAGKVDSAGHRLGIFSMLFILAVFGFPRFDAHLLVIFVLAAYLDEFAIELGKKRRIKNEFIARMASYRLLLELTAFAVSFYTAQWIIFASILFFDVGYMVVAEAGKKY